MKEDIRLFLSDNVSKYSLIFSGILLVVNIVVVVLEFSKLPPYIPLFNSLPWGQERLFPSIGILFFPVTFLIVFISNFVIGALVYKKYTLVSRLLSLNVLLYVLIGSIAVVQIMLLIF